MGPGLRAGWLLLIPVLRFAETWEGLLAWSRVDAAPVLCLYVVASFLTGAIGSGMELLWLLDELKS
jgi:hypothetical protein